MNFIVTEKQILKSWTSAYNNYIQLSDYNNFTKNIIMNKKKW